MMTIETPRLTLRPLAPDDATDLFPVMTDPILIRFQLRPPLTSMAELRRSLTVHRPALVGGVMVRKRDGRVLGLCGLYALRSSGATVEVGYLLARDCWGQGYASEGAAACVRAGLGLGMLQIIGLVHPDNHASQRVLERIGLTRLGTTDRYHAGMELVVFERRHHSTS